MSFILNELGVKPSIDLMNRTPGQLSTVTRGTQKIALLGEDVVTLTVESVRPIAFEIGDVMNVYGRTYRLNRLPAVQKQGERLYTYEVEMEGAQYDLLRVTYDLTIDTTSNKLQDVQGDALTGDLRRFATVLISNASRVFAGQWALGECPETAADRTLTFGETDNCLAVLQRLCKEFETEFEIAQAGGVRTIHFKKVGQTFPFTFRYGRGKGLYALERQNVSSSNIITRLKVYGSTRNITARYRAQRLCLPGKKKGESCIEKTDASWRFGVWEATKYFEDIYPKQKGRVTAVDAASELVFTDSAMAFDLSEKVTSKGADGKEETKTTYLLPGTSAKVHFNSGNLSGYEFEVAKYDHATKTFTLKAFKDDRGETFPSKTSAAFRIGVGDEYSLLDIAPPQAVVDAAEKELEEAGNKYYDQNSQPKVQYGLTVAPDFLRSLAGIGVETHVFSVGDYIPVEDEALAIKKSVRVQSFTRDLLQPYNYQLTLSDTVTTSIINRIISDQIETDKIIRMNNIKDPATARANWRRSREVMAAVFDPEGNYYTEKIRPQSIDTIALSVGAKSMQFGLTNTVFEPNYQGNPNAIRVQGGVLTHYTIDEAKARSWTLADGLATLSDASKPYYVYAKCQRAGAGGVILFTLEQIPVEKDPAYYHFWIGVLNSVDSELKARSFAPMYGFTMINGRFIKTGRIQSADGLTYFDLDEGVISGNIKIKGNSDYATKTELQVVSDQIKGEVGKFNAQLGGTKAQLDAFQQQTQQNVSNLLSRQATADDKIYRLQTAGFISRAEGNALYASAQLANGKTIASLITQTPEAINMISRNININAAVTFESYKEDNAQKLAAVNRRVSNTETTLSNQQNQLNQKQGKYDPFDINNARLNGKTVIEGGLIKTELINTRALQIGAGAKVAGFSITESSLVGSKVVPVEWLGWRTRSELSSEGWLDLIGDSGKSYLGGGALTVSGFQSQKAYINYDKLGMEKGGNEFSATIAHIDNDPDWKSYVQLKVKPLPHKNHIAYMPGGHDFKRVVIDINTGLMGWE